MNTALLVILIIIGNLSLYWLLFGKKKFEQKYMQDQEQSLNSTEAGHGRT